MRLGKMIGLAMIQKTAQDYEFSPKLPVETKRTISTLFDTNAEHDNMPASSEDKQAHTMDHAIVWDHPYWAVNNDEKNQVLDSHDAWKEHDGYDMNKGVVERGTNPGAAP